MADEGDALDLVEIDRLMGAWLESVEYAPERFLPGEMPDVDDAELMEKGDRSAAGRKAALARWGNRGAVNDSVRAKRSDAARRAAATRRAKKEEAAAAGKGPETDEQAAARMGAEFKAKRDTAEPIDAIDEIAARDDYEDFIRRNRVMLGLGKGEEFILQDACERIRAGKDRHEATYKSFSDEERVNVAATAEQFSKDGKVMVAMPPAVAMRIIGGDRAKSQFETNTSRGMFDPEVRATHETMASKVHPGIPPEKRHTYGYVAVDSPGRGLVQGGPTARGPMNYGDIRFELSDGVRDRTTMTLGDSLGSPAIPIKMGDSVDPRTAVASLGWGGDVSARKGDVTGVQNYGYAEAQIAGGWGPGDVAKVYVPQRSRSSEAYERRQWDDVAKAAEAAGITVERYDLDY